MKRILNVSCASKTPIPSWEIELQHRLSENARFEIFKEERDWMLHYHQELKQMYKIFQKNIERIELSFDEFRKYVYQNTERYYDPKRHKKVRLLI